MKGKEYLGNFGNMVERDLGYDRIEKEPSSQEFEDWQQVDEKTYVFFYSGYLYPRGYTRDRVFVYYRFPTKELAALRKPRGEGAKVIAVHIDTGSRVVQYGDRSVMPQTFTLSTTTGEKEIPISEGRYEYKGGHDESIKE